jgi:hypothetical protein
MVLQHTNVSNVNLRREEEDKEIKKREEIAPVKFPNLMKNHILQI